MKRPTVALVCLMASSAEAFHPMATQHGSPSQHRPLSSSTTLTSSSLSSSAPVASAEPESPNDILDTSTLTLLEHINLNVPSQEYILPFFYQILGLGMDPRKAANLHHETTGKKTLWANCGASQFHLPYGDVAQVVPGHIGLQYPDLDSLQALQERLEALPHAYESYEKGQHLKTGQEYIRIIDKYGNEYFCRVGKSRVDPTWKQPVISTTAADVERWGQQVVKDYGRTDAVPCCSGIAYVEFKCPRGTAEKIALFYDSVLDATTSVFADATSKVAVIAFGKVNAQGLADQSLLFRETDQEIPPYDGHHVAMYVGESAADFAQAFKNCDLAGIVWVNPRFSDKANTLQGAKKWQQFRFKDIVDMDTGEKVFELEHEIRCLGHDAWLGPNPL